MLGTASCNHASHMTELNNQGSCGWTPLRQGLDQGSTKKAWPAMLCTSPASFRHCPRLPTSAFSPPTPMLSAESATCTAGSATKLFP